MKESEAKYKICPILAVAAAVRGMELAGSCKGAACALWRELPAFSNDSTPRGICGLKSFA